MSGSWLSATTRVFFCASAGVPPRASSRSAPTTRRVIVRVRVIVSSGSDLRGAPIIDSPRGQAQARDRAATLAVARTRRYRRRVRAPTSRTRMFMRRARPTAVLLVRHGTTPTTGVKLPGRAPGLHLSDEGRRQAEAAAERIGALRRVAAVYASPIDRARETGAPIARARSLALRIERDVAEIDVGEWTGASLARLRRRPEWEIVQRHPSGFRFPGGE